MPVYQVDAQFARMAGYPVVLNGACQGVSAGGIDKIRIAGWGRPGQECEGKDEQTFHVLLFWRLRKLSHVCYRSLNYELFRIKEIFF